MNEKRKTTKKEVKTNQDEIFSFVDRWINFNIFSIQLLQGNSGVAISLRSSSEEEFIERDV